MGPSFWTPERLEIVKRMFLDEGRTAITIARHLGHGCTRNAVLGVAFRKGWKRPKAVNLANWAWRKGTGKGRRRAKSKKRNPNPPTLRVVEATMPRPWETRQPGECAWPIKIEGGVTMSCCAPVTYSSALAPYVYCARHRAIAYLKPLKTTKELVRSLRRYA